MAIHITNIAWTRTFFEVEYVTDAPYFEELFLFCEAKRSFVSFENEVIGATDNAASVRAKINVIVVQGRQPLPAGDWILCAKLSTDLLQDEEKLFQEHPYLNDRIYDYVVMHTSPNKRDNTAPLRAQAQKRRMEIMRNNPYDTHSITYEAEVLEKLEQLAQVFRYADGIYAYTASVIPYVDPSDYLCVMLSMGFYVQNLTPQVRKGSLRFKEKQILAAFAQAESKRFRHTGKRVLFFKENATKPTSNMAAVRDRMIERGLDKEFDIQEHYRNTFSSVRQDPSAWLQDISEIMKADYIFIDDYCPIFGFIKPAKGAVLTQLWHAGVGFKSVGYARFGIEGSPDPFNSAHRRYDYAVVGNRYLRDIYSEVFGIEPQALLATGMPRLDHFLDDDRADAAQKRLSQIYPWMDKGRVMIFAPTFRGTGQREAHYPYEEFFDFKKLYNLCVSSDSYFVFKMHAFIKNPVPIPEECKDRLFDLSSENLDELYYLSDVLITDYSSCFYDYLLLKKPVVFYTPDRIIYSVTRGVQRPVSELAPGTVCDTFDELIETLAAGIYEEVSPDPSCIDRASERGMLASDRVIDTILLGKDVPGVRLTDGGSLNA